MRQQKFSIISFTEQGNQRNLELLQYLNNQGHDCCGYTAQRYGNPFDEKTDEKKELLRLDHSLGEWTEKQFSESDGLVFIGETGIAVRAIAPCLKDKFQDPAVVVMDEKAKFVIPLLSGHVGGANELAVQIGEVTGAVPVLTTATDVNRKFAVDVFARNQNLLITDRRLAKEISAAVLKEEPVGLFSDFPIEGNLPDGLVQEQGQPVEVPWNRSIWITCKNGVLESLEESEKQVLRLIPKELVVGIGCRKGIAKEVIARQVEEVFSRYQLDLRGVKAVASIDLKKEEAGLVSYARDLGVPFYTYSAATLEQAGGSFQESDFVAGITGIGNVCERAAVIAAEETALAEEQKTGEQKTEELFPETVLLVKKQAGNGVTVAVALKDRKVVIEK
ncbi:MAG: cobalt-precorrin 5A hydrolase [Hungatella sp.]